MRYIDREPYFGSWMDEGRTKWDELKSRIKVHAKDASENRLFSKSKSDEASKNFWDGVEYACTVIEVAMKDLDQEERELLILNRLIEGGWHDEE